MKENENKNGGRKTMKGAMALSILLSGTLTPSMIGTTNLSYAAAEAITSATENPETDFTFTTNSTTNEVTITKYLGTSKEIVIPKMLGGKPVRIIGQDAFKSKGLTSVIIPEGVTKIGLRAFQANSLTYMKIPEGVTRIDSYAFQQNLITDVELPSTLELIDSYSFANNQLSALTVSEGTKTINTYAFQNNNLVEIYLPTSIKAIRGSAFESKGFPANNTTLYGYDSAIEVAKYALASKHNYVSLTDKTTKDIVNLESDFTFTTTTAGSIVKGYVGKRSNVVIPSQLGGKDVIAIGVGSFSGNGLDSVVIPNTVEDILASAFSKNNLKQVDIPEGVDTIETYAFQENQLESIVLPSTIKSLGNYVFDSNKLKSVEILSKGIKTMGTDVFARNLLTTAKIVAGNTYGINTFKDNLITSVEIEDGVTILKRDTFLNNQITEIRIPSSVKTIESGVFNNNLLKEVRLPEGTVSLASQSFYNNQITDFYIPSSLTSDIPTNTLGMNQNVSTNLRIHGYETSTKAKIWASKQGYTWVSLGEKYIPDAPAPATDFTYSKTSTEVTITGYKGVSTNLIIPTEIEGLPVKHIGKAAFSRKNLTDVILPTTLKSIGNEAFSYNKLTSVDVPEGVLTVGNQAFENNQIEELNLPLSLESTGAHSFAGNRIKHVELLSGVEYGSSTFHSNNIETVNIQEGVEIIPESIFSYNKIKQVDFPSTLKEIRTSSFNKNLISTVVVPEGVEKITAMAFGSNQINSITLPNSISRIDLSVLQTNSYQLGDVKVYGYDTNLVAKEWATSRKYTWVSLGGFVDWNLITNAVAKAEVSKLQTDVDDARILVNESPDGVEKIELTTRLDVVQKQIDVAKALAEQIATATASVVKAEGTKLQVDVDSAKALVTALPNGTEKTNLTTRLNTVQKAIDDAIALAEQIRIATASVVKAESSKTQVDVNAAKTLVDALPNGIEKTSLTTRINTVQKAIDDAKALAEQIRIATASVVKAESSKTQVDVNTAKALVNALPNGNEKTSLTTRLNTVQKAIDDAIALAEQIRIATASVVKAEGSKLQTDVNTAKILVNALSAGTEKTNLTNRLNTVQKAIDDAIALAEKISVATASVEKAESSILQIDVNSARVLVTALPDGTEKTNLANRLNIVQKAIDDAKALAEKIATATAYVVKSEGSKLQTDVDTAKVLVNTLPDGTEKNSLTDRLNAVQKAIDDAKVLAEQIATATAAVVKAEGSKLQVDVNSAKVLVNALPNGTEKTTLTNRLNAVQKAIDDAKALLEQIAIATASVLKAEGSKAQVDVNTAKALVTALPNGTEKTDLTNRLNTVQKAIDDAKALAEQIATATASVMKAEGSKLQADVNTAKALVTALPNGTEKIDLTTRLNTVQKAIDDAKALAEQIAVATAAVVKAEGSKTQVDVNTAKALVTALPNGTEKTNLTNRLNIVQKTIDDAKALADQIAVATASVVKAEGSKLQTDVNTAKALVTALPNGTEKTDLTNRLNTVQKAIDDANALAEQIAVATASVTKAEASKAQVDVNSAKALVTALPNGTEKTNLTTRLNTVQKAIDDAKALAEQIAVATASVVKAESSKMQVDVDSARSLVSSLPNGQEKTNLITRLDIIQQVILEEEAKDAIDNLGDNPTQEELDEIKDKIEELSDGPVKEILLDLIDQAQKKIEEEKKAAEELRKQIELATKAVEQTEQTKNQGDMNTARDLVEKLQNGEIKTDLINRLDAVQEIIDYAKKLESVRSLVNKLGDNPTQVQIDQARTAVESLIEGVSKAELSQLVQAKQDNLNLKVADAEKAIRAIGVPPTQQEINTAQLKVDLLPAGEIKENFQQIINQHQLTLDENNQSLLVKATNAVSTAEEFPTNYNIGIALNLVEALPSSDEKVSLQNRLQNIQDKLALEIAETKVQQAETYQSEPYLSEAINAVEALKESVEKQGLKARIQTIIDKLEAEKKYFAEIEKAVAAYEMYQTNYFYNIAKELVEKMPESNEKEAFKIRLGLNDVPGEDPVDKEQSALIEVAEKATVNYEKYKTSYYQKKAKEAIDALADGKAKTSLQERFDAVSK